MTEIGSFIFLAWATCTTIALFNCRDIAAPVMFVLAALGFFFSGLFFRQYSDSIIFLYLATLIIVTSISFLYYVSRRTQQSIEVSRSLEPIKYSQILLWLFSMPALLAQLYMFFLFGGGSGYLEAAKHGTMHFHGLGVLKSIIGSYGSISLLFFALYINSPKRPSKTISFYTHFGLFILLAALTLSRGALFTQFVAMAVIWHFSYKKIDISKMSIFLLVLLSLASIFGSIRETVTIDNGSLKVNWGAGCSTCEVAEPEYFKNEWMEFGLFPLQQVLEADKINMQYGMTYLTAVTNFVPRKIWPDKPAPGGVIFTQEYAPGFYDEYSHFATGLFPEAIMNFGLVGGIFFAYSILIFGLLFFTKLHIEKIKGRQRRFKSISEMVNLTIFCLLVYAFANLLVAEFTSLVVGLILKIVVIITVGIFLRIRLSNRNFDHHS